jgi:hypothetical protein
MQDSKSDFKMIGWVVKVGFYAPHTPTTLDYTWLTGIYPYTSRAKPLNLLGITHQFVGYFTPFLKFMRIVYT